MEKKIEVKCECQGTGFIAAADIVSAYKPPD
jgi:hypothetical protein